MEGKVLEPTATEMAAVSPLQHGAEQVSTIIHTTLTNPRTQHRKQNYPVGPGREGSLVKCFNALVTGDDATDLSDLDAAELNDIDSYLLSTTQMGACTDADIWKIWSADNDCDPTYSCGSRLNRRAHLIADPESYEVQPYSEIDDIHPHKSIATNMGLLVVSSQDRVNI